MLIRPVVGVLPACKGLARASAWAKVSQAEGELTLDLVVVVVVVVGVGVEALTRFEDSDVHPPECPARSPSTC